MSSGTLKPIPVPLRQRWQDVRMRLLPVLVFGATVAALTVLWKENVAAPTMVGQAEPVLAPVSSYKPGVLAELCVNRFQRVKAGDPVGKVLIADPKVLASSIAVIEADIEMLTVSMSPILRQQRNQMSYAGLRLDWMRQRADLAMARVRLQEADSDLQRMQELFKDNIISQRKFDTAKATRDQLQQQVLELTRLVEEQERNFPLLQTTNAVDVAAVNEDPIRAAIRVQDAKLKLTEAQLQPIMLEATMDGIVTSIYHRSGEAVMAGQPVIAIATYEPVRIVGYLRAPILEEPKVGMTVQVRTRSPRREVGSARIVEVGSQLETIPPALLGPSKFAVADQGLPVDISLPAKLKIRPGELVDITLVPKPD